MKNSITFKVHRLSKIKKVLKFFTDRGFSVNIELINDEYVLTVTEIEI